MTLLVLAHLAKRFGGVTALDNVSFTVTPGEMLALIGPNGAGKTTCFNIIGGQLPPDSGRVTLGGIDITGSSPVRRSRLGLGRTFQTAAVFTSMSVRENVQTALLAHHRRTWRFWRAADGYFVQAAQTPQTQAAFGVHAAYGAAR